MRKLILIFLCSFILMSLPLEGFSQGLFGGREARTTSVEELPNVQIEQLVKRMEEQGISTEEAIAIARAKGASDAQVDQLIKRIDQVKNKTKIAPIKEATIIQKHASFSKKEQIQETKAKRQTFGFQFFNSKNPNFASNMNTPLPDNYLIGVGDNIQLNVYGASQRDYSLQVQKNRAINIPNIGPVYIAGLSLKTAKILIKRRLSSIYNGMRGHSPNTFVNITVGNISGININVIGEASRPGTYTLPATATAFNALYLSGGPGENGSFRDINVVRDGKVVAKIDVYNYLINGDTRSNIQLRNNDVILIKPYQKRVFVEGAFKRKGIFEAKGSETIADIIRYAGGFAVDAYDKQISLTRNNSRTLSFKTVKANDFASTIIVNGDEIKAGQITGIYENIVNISGAVYRPGNYELSDGLTLLKLIKKADGLKADAFLDRGIITRKDDYMQMQTLSFSVRDVLKGKTNIFLKKNDKVLISSIFDMRENRKVEILGAVQRPGTFVYAEGMTLYDIIFMAGGFQEKASVSNIEIARRLSYKEAEKTSDKLIHTYTISVERDLKLSKKDSQMLLQPFDYIYVRTAPGFSQQQGSVAISGQIKYAGSYGIVNKKERLSDIIKRAGGLLSTAYVEGASLRRKYTLSDAEYQVKLEISKRDSMLKKETIVKTGYKIVGINLKKALKNPQSAENLLLENGDQIFIPKTLQTVKVTGAVLNPVALTYKKNMTTKDYINLSGGFSQNAKKNRVYVVYPNGEAHATRSFIFRSYPKVVPGAEIIVPEKEKIDRTGQAQKWLGISGSVLGIATSIAAIISLTRK